ncbi:MAG: DivIVA domain-containing protein [Actinobacteria bacterium]|nr:DivIVA domain-containing protein [Actinomycetota bacterium]
MLTPDEIASREFLISLRGYDRDEVASFLRQVAEEHAHLQRRIRELESELETADDVGTAPVVRQEASAARPSSDPRDAFRALGEETTRILVAAEESAQTIKQRAEERAKQELETARREARDEVESARRTASKIVADAERRRNSVAEDIRNLESMRDGFLRDLRSAIKTAQGAMRGLQPGDGDGNGRTSTGGGGTATRTRAVENRTSTPRSVRPTRGDEPAEDDGDVERAVFDDGTESVRVIPPTTPAAPSASPPTELGDEETTDDLDDELLDEEVDEDLEQLAELEDELEEQLPDVGAVDAEASEPLPRQLREQSLAGVRPGMLRRLRRSLQDVQNTVLDSVRRSAGDDSLDSLLPSRDLLAPLTEVGESFLSDAYRAGLSDGATLADGDLGDGTEDPSRVPASSATFGAVLSHEIVASLKATLRAGMSADEPTSQLSERVGEVFRDLKGPVVEGIADEHLVRTYGYGVLDAWRELGVASKAWVPGDAPRCPEDMRIQNADAGAVGLDDHFPTGEVVPPAHAGCDCALAPR